MTAGRGLTGTEMPKSESTRIEALESLLKDRRKHESFLAKLEERRASTPDGSTSALPDPPTRANGSPARTACPGRTPTLFG